MVVHKRLLIQLILVHTINLSVFFTVYFYCFYCFFNSCFKFYMNMNMNRNDDKDDVDKNTDLIFNILLGLQSVECCKHDERTRRGDNETSQTWTAGIDDDPRVSWCHDQRYPVTLDSSRPPPLATEQKTSIFF